MVAEVWLGSALRTAGGLTSAQSHTCLLPSPGCTVQGPGRAAWVGSPGGALQAARLLAASSPRDTSSQGPRRLSHSPHTDWLEPLVRELGTRYREPVAAEAGGRRQSLLLGRHWGSKPCAPTLLSCLLWSVLSSSVVLQVPVDGPEAEREAEEPHGGLHQVRMGFCPGERLASSPAGWGPRGFPQLGGAQSHHQLPAPPLCRARAGAGWAGAHWASRSLQVDGGPRTDEETEAHLRPQRQETAEPGLQGFAFMAVLPAESVRGDGVSFLRTLITVTVSSWERTGTCPLTSPHPTSRTDPRASGGLRCGCQSCPVHAVGSLWGL